MCRVCTHIYKHWILVLFWEGWSWSPSELMGKCMGLEIVPQYCGIPAQATVMAFPLLWLLLYQNLASVTEQSNSQDPSYNNDSFGVSSFPGEQRHHIKSWWNPKPSATEIYHGAELIKRNKKQIHKKTELSSRITGVWFSFGLNCSHLADTLARTTKMNVPTPKGRDNFFSFPWVWWNL